MYNPKKKVQNFFGRLINIFRASQDRTFTEGGISQPVKLSEQAIDTLGGRYGYHSIDLSLDVDRDRQGLS